MLDEYWKNPNESTLNPGRILLNPGEMHTKKRTSMKTGESRINPGQTFMHFGFKPGILINPG